MIEYFISKSDDNKKIKSNSSYSQINQVSKSEGYIFPGYVLDKCDVKNPEK